MNKKIAISYPDGSAERVIAHAVWQESRGRNPSMNFVTETDPRKALALAYFIVDRVVLTALETSYGLKIANTHSWDKMSNDELKVAIRAIIQTSSSKREINRRVRRELDYPHNLKLDIKIPTDETGRRVRELARGSGGLIMTNGAMVMGTICSRDNTDIDL